MIHDKFCPLDGDGECDVCAAIALARSEEKVIFGQVWKHNLPIIERRWYQRGHADASNGLPVPEYLQ